jgi:hypothetical protein
VIVGDIVLLLERGSDFATELDNLVGVAQIFAALVIEMKAGCVLEGIWDDLSCHLPDREFADFFAEEFQMFVDLEYPFHDARVVMAVVLQIAIFHGVVLFLHCVFPEVLRVDSLNQLLELLALDIRVAGIVGTDSLDDVLPILCALTFEGSSSNLAEDLPSSVFEEVIAIAECE